MRSKLWSKVTVLLFGAIILLVPLYWLLFPKAEFSPEERRFLATAPHLSEQNVRRWTYVKEAESFLADHLPLRNALVGIDAYVTWLTGRQVAKDIWVDREGWLLEAPMEEEAEELARRLARIANLGMTTGTQPYVMAVPSAGFIRRDLFSETLGSLYPDSSLLDVVDQTPGIRSVSLKGRFDKDGRSWYYSTDHHWNSDGAYAAYESYMLAAGHLPMERDAFYHHSILGYRGSTWSRSALWLKTSDRLTVDVPADQDFTVTFSDRERVYRGLFFYDHLEEYDWYPLFLDGNHAVAVITNNSLAEDSPTLLLVKDSFGNALAPLLAGSYKTIVMVDPRYYRKSISALYDEYRLDEILFCYSIKQLTTSIELQILK